MGCALEEDGETLASLISSSFLTITKWAVSSATFSWRAQRKRGNRQQTETPKLRAKADLLSFGWLSYFVAVRECLKDTESIWFCSWTETHRLKLFHIKKQGRKRWSRGPVAAASGHPRPSVFSTWFLTTRSSEKQAVEALVRLTCKAVRKRTEDSFPHIVGHLWSSVNSRFGSPVGCCQLTTAKQTGKCLPAVCIGESDKLNVISPRKKKWRTENEKELDFCHILFGKPRGSLLFYPTDTGWGSAERKENRRKWKLTLLHWDSFYQVCKHMARKEMWICICPQESVPFPVFSPYVFFSTHRLQGGDAKFGCGQPGERPHGMLDRCLKL